MSDQNYMKLALSLAQKGCGRVNPNPMVGAVIVKDGRIIGMGYHEKYGGPHAERQALASCSESPNGSVMYVTLEPCCHQGKTPPCTEAIIESGISRVVIGSSDPNPVVSGKGIPILRGHGIMVDEGVMKEECDRINEVFFHFIRHNTPYTAMKYAMTMDGKTAAVSGESKWITGEEARRHVHKDRNRYAAIMTGVGTVLADDPLLTCRIEGGRNPVRIICDTSLRTPLSAQVVTTISLARTIIFTCCTNQMLHMPYLEAGCEIFTVPSKNGHVDLNACMKLLGEQKIDSVLLEGGSILNWSALESGIVNKVQAYIAPKLFGGQTAKTPVGGDGVQFPSQAFRLLPPSVTVLGNDILLESEVIPCSQES
ncbi:bifunctional diaminohydroxyphosphoribosylaminopyrimidine deaminase/5-amino-6-(5-phosphoribosylamino)uracil reductase RibD [Clostridium sp. AM58-1XD]|uniref:bifunctional diaminohydroxyphosphoribosylaminopyrimidine deaminase/5-amino-6-(5-phosphoribosylamino)uracil reductase RibD n=1 Tax=Clostridium sp. AM58-1XD TaxID=2292307 RepID=UPI000E54A1F5|nr:bifunctional diaminohydroxyphosphoribosylaminopyrimidine deaminase/5-amino-6-(5-phosphoribosylamino)uracil reductase RibD [Clostridium sp. AM58-1XD]RGY98112.1 bifunctional diaminohydroxyphosphoribosylaminopyrimidine deaminase/5-amino-6-(5-phosphoribosylamino)uracil reductase RibD [Clostridium sp. AM58-1XD]